MAAKLKLTDDRRHKICLAIEAGNYNVVAAQACGVGETTFYRWMREGEEATSGAKREFWMAVKDAEAKAETSNVEIIKKAAITSWQAAAWLLERKHFDRWGRKDRQEHVGKDGGPLEISFMQLAKEALED